MTTSQISFLAAWFSVGLVVIAMTLFYIADVLRDIEKHLRKDKRDE